MIEKNVTRSSHSVTRFVQVIFISFSSAIHLLRVRSLIIELHIGRWTCLCLILFVSCNAWTSWHT